MKEKRERGEIWVRYGAALSVGLGEGHRDSVH